MQFKHPEVLYALFLLLIPIIIHLFQLRKFQKVDFTNVAFLKKVTIQTRKSSQLKKWITLLLRLGAIACIVIAFAHPYSASKTTEGSVSETVLYIDNSFSMEAKGANGPLLNRSIQQLYEQASGNERISWFTNKQSYKDVSIEDFKAEVLNVDYVQEQLSAQEVLLRAEQLFSSEKDTQKRLLYVSDLQLKGELPQIPEDIVVELVQPKTVSLTNVAIDTAYIAAKDPLSTTLNVTVSGLGEAPSTVPVSLYNGDQLLAKIAADLSSGTSNTVRFDIDETDDFKGRLIINDPNLRYDNSLFFSINAPEKIKVLSINDAAPEYLNRLFDQEEFLYTQQAAGSINYNDIPNQNFIILNELKSIPLSLITALKSFADNGGGLAIIPSEAAILTEYNNLLTALQIGSFGALNNQEKNISRIVFDHPLFASVFEKQVINFQFPKVNSYYQLNSNATAALQFEDGKPFIVQKDLVFLATAPVNTENSNFQNSPLIVPTLFNMAMQSLPLPKLYYEVGKTNMFAVPVSLVQDEILKIRDSVFDFIPLQQTKANQVIITTSEEPSESGNYVIEKNGEQLELLSYNYNRSESALQYNDGDNWEGVRRYSSVAEMFDTLTEENSINSYWKWFVIFALVCLIMEMLVLKFFKN